MKVLVACEESQRVCIAFRNKGLRAKEFFLKLLNAPIEKIFLENPVQFKIFQLPAWSQEIEPWEFGEPYTKKTRLWLKNLPYLMPTLLEIPKASWTLTKRTGKDRSKTFLGVAVAMAQQWG